MYKNTVFCRKILTFPEYLLYIFLIITAMVMDLLTIIGSDSINKNESLVLDYHEWTTTQELVFCTKRFTLYCHYQLVLFQHDLVQNYQMLD